MTDTLSSVEEYRQRLPAEVRQKLDQIRLLVGEVAPEAIEVISYGVIGYKLPPGDKRGFVFVGGYAGHIGLYPVPHLLQSELANELQSYIAGKGTLRFGLDQPLPIELIKRVIEALYSQALAR